MTAPGPLEPGEILGRSPVFRFFGMRLVEATPERVVIHLPAREDFRQEEDVVHGGVLTALADTAAAYCVALHLDRRDRMPGIELKLNFLRAGRIGGEDLVAVGTARKVGRRVAVGEATLHQGDRELAQGSFSYLVVPMDG